MKNLLKSCIAPFGVVFLLGCAPEKEAAQLLNALVTTPDYSLESASELLPDKVDCGKSKLDIEGGFLSFRGSLNDENQANLDLDIAVLLPIPANLRKINIEQYMFECKLNITYTFQRTSDFAYKLSGQGEVSNCNNFDCKLRGQSVDCEKLKLELPKQCT